MSYIEIYSSSANFLVRSLYDELSTSIIFYYFITAKLPIFFFVILSFKKNFLGIRHLKIFENGKIKNFEMSFQSNNSVYSVQTFWNRNGISFNYFHLLLFVIVYILLRCFIRITKLLWIGLYINIYLKKSPFSNAIFTLFLLNFKRFYKLWVSMSDVTSE